VLLPRAGGNYVFLKESYGRWAGFLFGWVEFWIIRAGSIAALATIFTEQVHSNLRQLRDTQGEVLSFWARQSMTIGVVMILAAVNARGTRWGGVLQLIITTVKVFTLVCIALLPFIIMGLVSDPVFRPTTDYLAPVWPSDFGAIDWSLFGGGLIGIFWAYHGWMGIAPLAEEVKQPQRNIPLALFCGVFTIIVLYVSANFAYYLVIPRNEIIALHDRTVAVEFGLRLLGSIGGLLASTAVMISVFGGLNGNLLIGPRLLFAMGRDGLIPRVLGQMHSRYQTPLIATTVLTFWTVLLIVCVSLLVQFRLPPLELGSQSFDLNLPEGKDPFDVITDFAMFGAISFETLGVASIFILRRRYPKSQVPLPYRCPFFPILPAVYVLAMAAVLFNMFTTQRAESMTGLGFILVGAIAYGVYFSRRERVPT